MANRKHLGILEQGVYDWNQWREEHPDVIPDLSEAYLREANLVGFDLRDASLHKAMLLGADLSNADLRRANLSGADVRFAETNGARLAGVRFEKTKGVTAGMMRQAQRPMRLQRRLSTALKPALIAAAAIVGVILIVNALASVNSEPEEVVPTLPSQAAMTAPPADPPGALTDLLLSIRFADWSVLDARVQTAVLTLVLDVDDVDETVYLPTLAATCGALEGQAQGRSIREIRILERTGESGWAYDRPRNCPAIMQAPTHMLRLAAGADSLRWQAR